jgi:hypothetical protein
MIISFENDRSSGQNPSIDGPPEMKPFARCISFQ